MLTCAEAIALEEHLRGCDEGVADLNTYRKTPALVVATLPVEMPPEMKRRLRGFLIARLAGS